MKMTRREVKIILIIAKVLWFVRKACSISAAWATKPSSFSSSRSATWSERA